MTFTIELLPDTAAADLRLRQLAAERSSPLERLNLLCGSGLQRVASLRMLAEAHGGAVTAIYGFTPVDLAQAAAQRGDAPSRQAWPPGADLLALRRLLRELDLERWRPDAPGLDAALLRSLTDLREAALSPDDLPTNDSTPSDLRRVYASWRELVTPIADRTSRYEDAVSPTTPTSAFREALDGAPLIVSGIYDLTRIQRLMLARVADAVDVQMLLVAPSDDPSALPLRTVDALRRELDVRVERSALRASPPSVERFFSAGDPTAEADEIASRILDLARDDLARDGVAAHRIAVLHQQGPSADDRICAALDRAGLPSWRIAGQPLRQTPIGRAAQELFRVLLAPDEVERSDLIDWLAHRSLTIRPLGHRREVAVWERVSLEAGLARGLGSMRSRIESWRETQGDPSVASLADLIADLDDRSRRLAQSPDWDAAVDELRNALDGYVGDVVDDVDGSERNQTVDAELHEALRQTLEQLRAQDVLGIEWSTTEALVCIERAIGARAVRDPRRLVGGVNVGAATGPARGIAYDAVFLAGVAERVFPALGRSDPLLTDETREAVNRRTPNALALQRDRAESDRHAWALARASATTCVVASWSRRGSAVGGPAQPSSLILEAAAVSSAEIERIGGSTDWSRTLEASDARAFDLAMLNAAEIDTHSLLPLLWPQAEAASHAREQRNAPRFTEFDGMINAEALAPGGWRPLERSWSAAALETYVTCPYQFFLRHVLGARGGGEAAMIAERPDRPQRDAVGRLVRRIFSSWVREYEHVRADRTWFEYADQPTYLHTLARRFLDAAAEAGALGPSAEASTLRGEILNDLDRARRREASDARNGWRPLEVNVGFDDAPIRIVGDRTLRLRGMVDRIDEHVSGRQRALILFAARGLAPVHGYRNGSSFLSVASLAMLQQRGVSIDQAEVEHHSVTRAGDFESETLAGASLTARGGSGAPSDGERLRDALATIVDQLEAGNFAPFPGEPLRDRPNCVRCEYESCCSVDLERRYSHKRNRDPESVRALEQLRRQLV